MSAKLLTEFARFVAALVAQIPLRGAILEIESCGLMPSGRVAVAQENDIGGIGDGAA
jgi:hypothetical protein